MNQLVTSLGGVLIVLGVIVLCRSTDFDPNPFMQNMSNPTGQISGVIVASIGAVIAAIGTAAMAICRSIEAAQPESVD
jgi:hypothetical protein